jgi:hypothetical protein
MGGAGVGAGEPPHATKNRKARLLMVDATSEPVLAASIFHQYSRA